MCAAIGVPVKVTCITLLTVISSCYYDLVPNPLPSFVHSEYLRNHCLNCGYSIKTVGFEEKREGNELVFKDELLVITKG